MVSANEVVMVLDATQGRPHEMATGLASVALSTAEEKLGKSFKGAKALVERMIETQWTAFDLLKSPPAGKEAAAREVLDELARAFREDDLVIALDPKLPRLVERALKVTAVSSGWNVEGQEVYEAPGIDPATVAEEVRETLERYAGQPVRFEWKLLRKKDGS